MASNLPTVLPPRTPTPPPDDSPSSGTGFNGFMLSPAQSNFDARSPMDENFMPSQQGSIPSITTTTIPLGEQDTNSIYSPMSADSRGPLSSDSGASKRNSLMVEDHNGVFNFQPGLMAKGPVAKSVCRPSFLPENQRRRQLDHELIFLSQQNIGQRRGHKYKHSSVSHQFFLEPPPRPPPQVPTSLPVPTFKECRRSMSKEQTHRFYWSITHALVAAYTLWSAEGSLALTALSHLILFDSLGAMLCVVVDILGNFEVWKRSSIRHPFGLERAEVLAGFAMSVLLAFMGMDLVSHNLQHVLENVGSHEAHEEHNHVRVSAGEVDFAALLAIVSTLISAFGLGNHRRIARGLRFTYISRLPSILANPSHFLTISCSLLLLALPLLSIQIYTTFDRILSTTVAVSMCFLGFRLVKTLGFMLLMSNDNTSAVIDILREVESDPSVTGINDVRFWQVHYGLCMAGLKIRVRGSEEGLGRLRERVCGLVRQRLGGGYGGGGARWEVSCQFDIDRF